MDWTPIQGIECKTLDMPPVKFMFRWYDLWIGLYIDTERGCVYICPFPCIVVRVSWRRFRPWLWYKRPWRD